MVLRATVTDHGSNDLIAAGISSLTLMSYGPMSSVSQIPKQDTFRRIRQIQTVTIVWMTVEAAISLAAAWIARSPALLARLRHLTSRMRHSSPKQVRAPTVRSEPGSTSYFSQTCETIPAL